MKKSIQFKQFVSVSIGVLIGCTPVEAHAASAAFFGPVISPVCNCVGSAPAWGCIIDTVQRTNNLAISLATVIITLFIVLAGFTYMTSGGNAEKRSLANKRIANAIIGLLIVLCAWLLIDSVLKVVYDNGSFGPWNAILTSSGQQECLAIRNPPASLAPLTPANNANASGGTGTAGPVATTAVGNSGVKTSAAIAQLDSHTVPIPGNGKCAVSVREALEAGGMNTSGHPVDAKDYGTFLNTKGYATLGSDDSSPRAGDIVVTQPYPGGSPQGHVAMYDGSQWVSDFKQQDFWGGPGYRSFQPAHAFYRG